MEIKYKITEYFEDNNLFDNKTSNGLKIENNGDSLLIKGDSIDLVNLADMLVNIALDKEKGVHVHIDDLSFLDKESEYKDIIIEKN